MLTMTSERSGRSRRIVSLLPSATETLFAVGAGDDVVGVTFECDFPPEARTRRIVSTTSLPRDLTVAQIDKEVRARVAAGEDLYTLDEGALRALDPDMIVTQDLCAVCAVDVADVEQALEHLGCRAEVVTVDPMTLDDVLRSIGTLGTVTGHARQASALVSSLRDRVERVESLVADRPRPRMAVLEWTDPPFAPGHWLPDLVMAAGATCALGESGRPSRRIDWDDIAGSAPDLIVVAPCGFGLDDAAEIAETLCATGQLPSSVPVWAVDANAAFVRPGPRLVDGIEALAGIVHAESTTPRPDLARRIA
jgi:iron complex transport system substrate-binding protein